MSMCVSVRVCNSANYFPCRMCAWTNLKWHKENNCQNVDQTKLLLLELLHFHKLLCRSSVMRIPMYNKKDNLFSFRWTWILKCVLLNMFSGGYIGGFYLKLNHKMHLLLFNQIYTGQKHKNKPVSSYFVSLISTVHHSHYIVHYQGTKWVFIIFKPPRRNFSLSSFHLVHDTKYWFCQNSINTNRGDNIVLSSCMATPHCTNYHSANASKSQQNKIKIRSMKICSCNCKNCQI